MSELRLITWNVLHRIHAVNWDETAIAAHADEQQRNARIADTVGGWLESGADVVCLQEVSGDQLAALRLRVGVDVHVFEHCYPRLPKLRVEAPAPLADAKEYLVVLARARGARHHVSETFPTDHGKGFVAVSLPVARALVVCTHVSYGPRREAQLARLLSLAESVSETVVVAGDTNAERDDVARALGEHCDLTVLDGTRHTRVGSPTSISHDIDHVGVFRGRVLRASVLDGKALSDHNPVDVTVHCGSV